MEFKVKGSRDRSNLNRRDCYPHNSERVGTMHLPCKWLSGHATRLPSVRSSRRCNVLCLGTICVCDKLKLTYAHGQHIPGCYFYPNCHELPINGNFQRKNKLCRKGDKRNLPVDYRSVNSSMLIRVDNNWAERRKNVVSSIVTATKLRHRS